MLDGALAWHAGGCSVIPIRTDGSKAPKLATWRTFQNTRADEDQIRAWFGENHPGIGVVCGKISGNLEMLEFEGRAFAEGVLADFIAKLTEEENRLFEKVLAGYSEQSPSGGLHLFYRIADDTVDGNRKLAQRPARDDELTDDEREVLARTGKRALRALIETRGEGGQVVVAPSHGPVHPSGQPWRVIAGAPANIVTVTAAERDILHDRAMAFDHAPAVTAVPETFKRDGLNAGDRHPGEDFNERGTWAEILEPAGWTYVGQLGAQGRWRRPGKRHGVSAVTGSSDGSGRDYLYVYSTSTELPPETAMSKWRAFAKLWHREDYSAAAGDLRRKGYGSPLPERSRVSDLDMFTPGTWQPVNPSLTGQPPMSGPQPPQGRFAARLFRRDQLDQLPRPAPLIADTLDLGTVALLAGGWGSLKSFVVQDWSSSISSEQGRWKGRAVERHGKVLYVASEGAHGLDARLVAWEKHNGQHIAGANFVTLGGTPNLARFTDVAELYEIIHVGGFLVVVIDTLAKCMSGLDENSAKEMGTILEALYKLREATRDGMVIAVHHTGKAKTVRGSSALEAGVDTVYMTDGNADGITLRRTKRKDGPTEDELQLRLEVVDGTGSGVLIDSGTLTMRDFFGFGLTSAGNRLLEILLEAFDHDGMEFSTSEMQRLATSARNPMGLSLFYKARKDLIEKGMLADVSPGRRRSTRFRLQRPPQDEPEV